MNSNTATAQVERIAREQLRFLATFQTIAMSEGYGKLEPWLQTNVMNQLNTYYELLAKVSDGRAIIID
jgi:hypothetical protein